MPQRTHVRIDGVLIFGLAVTLASAIDALAQAAPETREVVIGKEYEAGGFHRWLWGTDYRSLWTTPVKVEVLDLHHFAGGLTPVMRVGGQQTKGLAMRGADGRDYTFRSIDKDPGSILPEDLRDTWVRSIIQDQMAASHPASFLVADELMRAAGILRTPQHLVVLPDDAALGEFRKDFAGAVGQVYEFPGAKSDKNPGFEDATEVLKHTTFYKRLQAGEVRPDARAFLKARLFDIMMGDWDRHRDQWRWVKLPGQDLWQPLPDDRDQAFSRYEGLLLDSVRRRAPFLQKYSARYPGMKGLTWNGWEQDRELLAGLERQAFRDAAADLAARITDDVIQRAVHRLPPEYLAQDGPRLVRDLTGRRNALPQAADAYYEHIADKVKVYLTDQPEVVEARRTDGGDLLIEVRRAGPGGAPAGEPTFRRTFHANETDEVQVYLRGGDDRVVTTGRPGPITLRVLGGPGHDVVDDRNGGGTHFYSTTGGEIQKGPGSDLDTKAYTPPPPPRNAPWIPPRDWGRDTVGVPWLGYGSDLGVFLGFGVDTRSHAFRKDPFGSRHILRAGWSFGESTYRADYRGTFKFENSGRFADIHAYASGIESSRFFGFGNETFPGADQGSDFFKVRQQQYSLTPALSFALGKDVSFLVGPTLKYARTTHLGDVSLINRTRPYGFGDFGEVGATAAFQIDTRVAADRNPSGVAVRSMGYPRRGALVQVRGFLYPKAWDVQDTFGSLAGSGTLYLTPGSSDRAPTLVLRAGGLKVYGDYPFFEAAYIGGGIGGITATVTEGTVRGLQKHRYAGDAMTFGNADLRLRLSRFNVFLPGEWGLVGSADTGRVFLDGEDSNDWHYGYGAGIWIAWLDRGNTLTISWARSERHNSFHFRAGFGF